MPYLLALLTSVRDGQYQLLQKLGTGGMGEVYQARDTRLNRLVAVKILRPEQLGNADLQQRFIREAQAASALNHPNIITIHDIVSEGGADILIMEFVSGGTLADRISTGGLPVSEVLSYAVQIASALTAAHSAGIVHRDLKPGNIMVTDGGLVKVLDFGLAKRLLPDQSGDETIPQPLTVQGLILGTCSYMSPEQAQGKTVDTRSDIFAFGAVLYEMATGARAFDGPDTITTLTAVIRDEPQSMVATHPSIPPELDQIVQRCLRKDPADRFQSMAEIHQALGALKLRFESGSLVRQQVTIAPPAAPPAGKPWRMVAVLAGLAAAVAGGGLWYWTQKPKPAPPPVQVAEVKPEPPSPPPADRPLRNDDVIAMVTEKVPVRLIMSQIRASKTDFDLTPGEIIRLVKGGVPEALIEVMRDPSKAQPRVESPAVKETAEPARPAAQPVLLRDGTPMLLVLKEVPPNNAPDGTPLRFEVAGDVVVEGVTVIAKGAAAGGQVSREKRSFGRSRAAYLMVQVESVDGKQLRLRTTSSPAKDTEAARRPMLPPGTHYPAYIDGDASITAR